METGPQPAATSAIRRTMNSLHAAFLGAVCAFPALQIQATDTPVAAVSMHTREEQLDKAERILQQAWADTATRLRQKNTELEREYFAQIKTLKKKKITGNVRQLERDWEGILVQTINGEDGREIISVEGYVRCHRELDNLLERNRWLMPQNDEGIDEALIRETEFATVNEWRLNAEERYREALMTDDAGSRLGLFPEEFRKDPTITTEKYIELLAKRLKTPHQLAMFLRLFFHYTHDTDDVTQPLRIGNKYTHQDYDQTLDETLRRTANNMMLGDCEDVCEVCKVLLEKMGIPAAIVYISGTPTAHCTCVWLEESNGKYIAGDMGTCGYYRDDRLIDDVDFVLERRNAPMQPSQGHEKKEDAMKAGLQHLGRYQGLSLSHWNAGTVFMQKDRNTWLPNQSWEQRWEELTMEEFTGRLLKGNIEVPMTTAEVPGPPLE